MEISVHTILTRHIHWLLNKSNTNPYYPPRSQSTHHTKLLVFSRKITHWHPQKTVERSATCHIVQIPRLASKERNWRLQIWKTGSRRQCVNNSPIWLVNRSMNGGMGNSTPAYPPLWVLGFLPVFPIQWTLPYIFFMLSFLKLPHVPKLVLLVRILSGMGSVFSKTNQLRIVPQTLNC